VKRRQLLKQLLQTSGGLIAQFARLPTTRTAGRTPILLDLLQPESRLPAHLITPLSEFDVQSYALPPSITVGG